MPRKPNPITEATNPRARLVRQEEEALASTSQATSGASPSTGPYMTQSQFSGTSAAGRERAQRPSEAELEKKLKKK